MSKMSTYPRPSSANRSSRTKHIDSVSDRSAVPPAESRKKKSTTVEHPSIPDELLASLTSTVCNGHKQGHTSHRHQCDSLEIRRPDAVWHNSLGRKKYNYFLEQPTSLNAAGRDISFLCDAVSNQKKTAPLPPVKGKSDMSDGENVNISEILIPEEYHMVKNKGIRCLKFYEDPFTVQLIDEEDKLRIFPSLKPSGRLEAVELMRAMDDMLEKAGVDQQEEELTELSQMEGLLELVKVEQNIYNTVFHELIRQVTVGCAERGQVLAKLRQRYQTLLDRIPRRLMALHAEALAEKTLGRRLTEEIYHVKQFLQNLSMETNKIREHHAFVTKQAERAHQQLSEILVQIQTDQDLVQSYHEHYEKQRASLEIQVLQMTEERDWWTQLSFSLALKLINFKKLHLVSRLDLNGRTWYKMAEHCLLHLSSRDTRDLEVIMEITGNWKELLAELVTQLKKTENSHRGQIYTIQQGVSKWFSILHSVERRTDPKHWKGSVEDVHADLKQWCDILTLQYEYYRGENVILCQHKLLKVGSAHERWLFISHELFERHPSISQGPERQQTARKLERVLAELVKHIDLRITGESGIHRVLGLLLDLVKSWIFKAAAGIESAITGYHFNWIKFEEALLDCQSLVEEGLWHFSATQTDKKGRKKCDIFKEAKNVILDVQSFVKSLCNFIDVQTQKLKDEVSCAHVTQTRWTFDLLLVMTPNCGQCVDLGEEHLKIKTIPFDILVKDADSLEEKLNFLTNYIARSCNMIFEDEDIYEIESCKKMQRECTNWVTTSQILIQGIRRDKAEEQARAASAESASTVGSLESQATDKVSDASSTETVQKVETVEGKKEEAETPSDKPTTESVKQMEDRIKAHLKAIDEMSAKSSEESLPAVEAETKDGPKVGEGVSSEPTASQVQEEKSEAGIKPKEETGVYEAALINLIGFDGNVTTTKLVECSIHLPGIDDLVVPPSKTERSQKSFSDLTTLAILQTELHDSELRVIRAEQRALIAEESLQKSMDKIQDLERQLFGAPSLDVESYSDLTPVSSLDSKQETETQKPHDSKTDTGKKKTKKK